MLLILICQKAVLEDAAPHRSSLLDEMLFQTELMSWLGIMEEKYWGISAHACS
jgi:hypothetical protein